MKYYVMINGRQAGPFEEFQLIGNGVMRDTQVWHEGMPQWQPAGMVPELAHLFAGEQQLGNVLREAAMSLPLAAVFPIPVTIRPAVALIRADAILRFRHAPRPILWNRYL